MREGSILENDFKEKDVSAVWRFLLFLPKLILITLIASLILFLAGLAYSLAQYYLTGEIPYFLPEASQVISFARGSSGPLAMGTVLAIILFVFALRAICEKKNEILNDEQANEAESLKMFQTIPEIGEGETSKQVVPLPIKKKALKKIYGKCREQEESKNEGKIRKKNKPNIERRDYYHDYNSGQRGNVVMFKQKRPSFQKGANRPKAAPEPRGPL